MASKEEEETTCENTTTEKNTSAESTMTEKAFPQTSIKAESQDSSLDSESEDNTKSQATEDAVTEEASHTPHEMELQHSSQESHSDTDSIKSRPAEGAVADSVSCQYHGQEAEPGGENRTNSHPTRGTITEDAIYTSGEEKTQHTDVESRGENSISFDPHEGMTTDDAVLSHVEEEAQHSCVASESESSTNSQPTEGTMTEDASHLHGENEAQQSFPKSENKNSTESQPCTTDKSMETHPFSYDEIMQYMNAAAVGDITVLQHFLDGGLPVDVRCPRQDNRRSGKGEVALKRATRSGAMEAVKFLVEWGADVNGKSGCARNTPLHLATMLKVENVRSLLTLGADIHATDADGETPFMLAVKGFDFEMINFLIKSGSDVNHQNKNGTTALHLCFEIYHHSLAAKFPTLTHNAIDSAKLLIEAGADMDMLSNECRTPLVQAILMKKVKGAQFLLMQNCDPDLPAGTWRKAETLGYPMVNLYSPFRAAVHTGQMEVIRFLLKAGCQYEDVSRLRMDPEFRSVLEALLCQPRSLVEACRLVTRRRLRECGVVGSKLPKTMESLNFPKTMTDFLLLKDIKSEPCSVI